MLRPVPPAVILLGAAVCWGLSIPVMKALAVEQSLLAPSTASLPASLASLTARFGLAALALMPIFRIAPWRINRAEWFHGSALALITAISMALQVDALSYTSASTAGFLVALYSVLVPLIAWMAGFRRMTGVLALSCVLVTAGMAVLTGFDPRGLRIGRGEWETLGAAFLFACQILWIDRIPADRTSPFKVTVALLTLVALFSLAASSLGALAAGASCATGFVTALWTQIAILHGSPRALALEAALALFGTAVPFALMTRFQSAVGSVAAGFIYCGEPIATALGAFRLPELLVREPGLYPNERPTWNLVVGGMLILAANLWLLRDRKEAATRPASALSGTPP